MNFTKTDYVKLLRIVAPHFTAGVLLVVKHNYVSSAAPIVGYMVGWTSERVYEYCKRKRWELQNL